MTRVYTHEEIEAFFDRDTYLDLLDLLKDLINRDYLVEHLRMDVEEYIEKIGGIDYERKY
jgi:hypothetical protein